MVKMSRTSRVAVQILLTILLSSIVASASNVIRVRIEGAIHPITAEILQDAIEQARARQAVVVLIELNTPGGLVDATRQSIERMVGSPIPVITYVTPSGGRAASAGFFLLEAGDVAAMAPGTNTGAASPVVLGQTMDPVMRSKAENDIAALMRSLASRRGRNSDLAEKAIREAKAFSDTEALKSQLIDLEADNESQLLEKLDGRQIVRFNGAREILHLSNPSITDVNLSWRERLIGAIADPNIGFLLLVLGALGIYVEFLSPGLIFPGVAGAVLALLGLSSLSVLPINWTGAALLLLALSLFVLELKFTSHGILGVGGAVSMLLGAMILVNGPPEMRIHWSTALSVTLPFALITMFLVSLAVKARRNKVLTGEAGLVDEIGVARTPLTPCGQVFVHGEYWEAIGSTNAEPGTRVRVTGVDGLTLHVQPLIEHGFAVPQR